MLTVDTTCYEGWENCVRLANDTVELVATTAVGPRVVHFGPVDGENLFWLDPETLGQTGTDEWHPYGGHRCWHAPEDLERTYVPDNDPVEYELLDDGVRLTQDTETATGIRKELVVRLDETGSRATVDHRLTNEGEWPIEFAPWGVTVLRPGGTAVLPLTGAPEGTYPDREISLWNFTDLGDDRLTFQREAILVDQVADAPSSPMGGDEAAREATKIGTSGHDGWLAYVLGDRAVRIAYDHDPTATYPDRNSAVEVFTNESILELETLAPLRTVEPGETVSHVERWELLEGLAFDRDRPRRSVAAAR